MKEVVIFGGTFDPVHKGHTAIIKHLTERFGKVAVIPCGIPPHKRGGSAKDRLAMLKMTVDGRLTDTLEIDRPDTSFTYKTLEYYAADYDKIYLCIGSDSLMDFTTWKNPDIIARLATLYVIPRAESRVGLEQFAQFIRTMYKAEVIIADFDAGDISSTEIRIRAAFDDYAALDENVAAYIREHKLYAEYRKYTDSYASYGLSKSRVGHNMRVAIMAAKLAAKNYVPQDSVLIAALLHDIAKRISVDEARDKGYINETEYNEIASMQESVRHSFIGPFVAAKDFGIKDGDILNAIRYHTTGRPDMSQLEKIVMLADYVEEGRNFENLKEIRELTFKELDAGLIATLENTVKYLRAENREICQLTLDAYDYYMSGE